MRIYVIGAGPMGCLYGGLLARQACEVTLVDTWQSQVDAINGSGLVVDGISGSFKPKLRALSRIDETGVADVAIILTDTNSTRAAAETAKAVLKPSGYALTLQNGMGNVEALCEILGKERVLAGLSYHSAVVPAPGRATHTNAGPTWIGELDGVRRARLAAINDLLERAGLGPKIADDIMAVIWSKVIHNSAVNPICATMGIRAGEIPTTPGAHELQTKIIEEALAVLRAMGVPLADPDPFPPIRAFCQVKFNKPSMLLHIEQGKQTEIDALNGAIVREGKRLGVPTPYNEAITWLVKGLESQRSRTVHGPALDYVALEKAAVARHTK